MAIVYNTSIVNSSLVCYLDAANTKSYPGTGTTWTDLSGNGNNGTLTNGPTFDSSNNGSIVLDGTNDVVTLSYDLRTSWTYECWVMHNVVSGFCFLGQGTTVTNSGLHIWFYNSTNIRFGMYSNDTDVTSLTTSTGVWYQYCFTYDHSSPYAKQIYRNGVQLTGSPLQTQTQYIGTGTIQIGSIYSSSASVANGKFSVAKFYNRVLTATEIAQNFNALRGRYGI